MQVVIRADASLQIGTGHVMRCLTLADRLKEQGVNIHFICRSHPGNLIEMIESKGYGVFVLDKPKATRPGHFKTKDNLFHAHWLGVSQQQDAEQCREVLEQIKPDWLIVDHYAIDQVWQSALKWTYRKLMVIDDIGDRHHQCDLLLDQNYGSSREKHQLLVSDNCVILTGPSYALLRSEFAQWRDFSLKRRVKPEFKKILITLGGVDPENITGKVLAELKKCSLPKGIEITVIMGATAPHLKAIIVQVKSMPYKIRVKLNVNNMAEIMAHSDLAIGAAGATTWERCCLGLPTIQMVIAENQKEIATNLAYENAIKLLNSFEELPGLVESATEWMAEVSQISAKVCDGLGAQKVEQAITRLGAL